MVGFCKSGINVDNIRGIRMFRQGIDNIFYVKLLLKILFDVFEKFDFIWNIIEMYFMIIMYI